MSQSWSCSLATEQAMLTLTFMFSTAFIKPSGQLARSGGKHVYSPADFFRTTPSSSLPLFQDLCACSWKSQAERTSSLSIERPEAVENRAEFGVAIPDMGTPPWLWTGVRPDICKSPGPWPAGWVGSAAFFEGFRYVRKPMMGEGSRRNERKKMEAEQTTNRQANRRTKPQGG